MPETKEDNGNILTPGAKIHIEGTASCCNTKSPKKKLKQKTDSLKWKRTAKLVKPKKCELQARILLDLPENPISLLVFESTTSLNDFMDLTC